MTFFFEIVSFLRQFGKLLSSWAGHLTIWPMRISCWITKTTNTPRMYSTYCISTATMVARTRLIITLYVHCLSCFTELRLIVGLLLGVNRARKYVASKGVFNEDENFVESNIALFLLFICKKNHLLTVNKILMMFILNSRNNKAVCFNKSLSSSGHPVQ